MFVDDLGLPINSRATAIFHEVYLMDHPDADPAKLIKHRPIAGTRFLFEEPVWF
jgi:hypothetical protein